MLSVRFFLKEGYPVSCELKDGENVFFGGVTAQGEFFCEKGVPYPEMMLRALVNKCMDGRIPVLFARDEWGVDLARFGFEWEGERYACPRERLRLPHDCEKAP